VLSGVSTIGSCIVRALCRGDRKREGARWVKT